mgnify:CR=1 FL=1
MMDQETMLSVLKDGLLFRNMEDAEILETLETTASHRRTYPKRTLVMRDGPDVPGGCDPVGKSPPVSH